MWNPTGKEFKKDAKVVTAYLTELPTEALKQLEASANASGAATITVDGRDFSISKDFLVCESKTETQHVETFVPNVVEPSFGIDRILTAMCDLAAISPQPRAPRALPSFDAAPTPRPE